MLERFLPRAYVLTADLELYGQEAVSNYETYKGYV